jgi:hypothetical protein
VSTEQAMDWFERLTGFQESKYDYARGKLRVEGRRLQSLIEILDRLNADISVI